MHLQTWAADPQRSPGAAPTGEADSWTTRAGEIVGKSTSRDLQVRSSAGGDAASVTAARAWITRRSTCAVARPVTSEAGDTHGCRAVDQSQSAAPAARTCLPITSASAARAIAGKLAAMQLDRG